MSLLNLDSALNFVCAVLLLLRPRRLTIENVIRSARTSAVQAETRRDET